MNQNEDKREYSPLGHLTNASQKKLCCLDKATKLLNEIPIMSSIKNGHEVVVIYLISRGAKIVFNDYKGEQLIDLAVRSGLI